MGNTISPCFQPNRSTRSSTVVKLIFWQGTTRLLLTGAKRHLAGEIMFEFPDRIVCHADSFFIGQPLPALAMDDELMAGQTYFVLPIESFACKVLSASSLAALGSSPDKRTSVNFKDCPFEHVKGSNGKVLIKVVPEFIVKIITRGKGLISEDQSMTNSTSFLCSTPELRKQYDLLVGSRDQVWSPKLDTISEYKIRFSPCRFLGLEWKLKEQEV